MSVRRMVIGVQVVLYAAWLVAMTWYVWPRSAADPRSGTIIVAHSHELVVAGGWVLVALLVGTAAALISGATRERWSPWYRRVTLAAGQVALVVGFAIAPLTVLSTAYRGCSQWREVAHLRASNGRQYRVQRSARWDVLSEEVERSTLFLRTRALAVTEGSSEGVPLARPAEMAGYEVAWHHLGANKGIGKLVRSRNGRWLVFLFGYALSDVLSGSDELERLECRTTLVYELQSGRVYAGKTLLKLSPFILIGPSDALDDDDVKALREMRRYDFNLDRLYEFGAIAGGATHANPAVRRLAAQMLGEFWDAKDGAMTVLTKLAREDPDAGVRKAAYWAARALNKRVAERRRGGS